MAHPKNRAVNRCNRFYRFLQFFVKMVFIAFPVNFLRRGNYHKGVRVDVFYDVAYFGIQKVFCRTHNNASAFARISALTFDVRRADIKFLQNSFANYRGFLFSGNNVQKLCRIAAVKHEVEKNRKHDYGNKSIAGKLEILEHRKGNSHYDEVG